MQLHNKKNLGPVLHGAYNTRMRHRPIFPSE